MTHPDRYQPTEAVARQSITSQATIVEQSRAVAEVQAAVLVAQQRPRNRAAAVQEMRDATAQMSVASRAYFRYNRGDGTVTGVSIHLARELARCWGNVDYGLKELRRDDTKGESEMLAHAWDMQTNARASTTFIVPHIRDTKKGPRQLTETRDIYENNANNGARRLREMILAVLPAWFVQEAQANCDATLENGGGKPLAGRIADALRLFEEIGVSAQQLEAKLGRSSSMWNGHDVGQLGVIYSSIKRGETNTADEFDATAPEAESGVSAAEIASTGRKKRAPRRPAAEAKTDEKTTSEAPENTSEPATPPEVGPATDDQVERLGKLLDEVGLVEDEAGRWEFLSHHAGREITVLHHLTAADADRITALLVDSISGPPADETAGGAQ
ncbi:hypothetical protein [Nocardia brasiliensis]|uniref:hypothetical protein n=1 Tax=Nocardia brasiliensis TaxID=37326 RepID=UPI00366E592C